MELHRHIVMSCANYRNGYALEPRRPSASLRQSATSPRPAPWKPYRNSTKPRLMPWSKLRSW